MKRTLITIALTTVVVLTLVGVAFFSISGSYGSPQYSNISRSFDGG